MHPRVVCPRTFCHYYNYQEVLLLMVGLLTDFSCEEAMFTALRSEMKKGFHNCIIKPEEAAR